MIIAHNLMANFSKRQLNINTESKSKSTERLSSGYRINRAADDAAGLAISEKMRGQIRGLERASHNVEDGISLIQVADGAMQEVTNMCQRIRVLAVQAANDTNTDDDRELIQEEIEWLKEEINNIGESTEFNTIKVLQGKTLSDQWEEKTLVDFRNEKDEELVNGNPTGESYYYFDDDPVYKGGAASDSVIEATKTMDFSGVSSSNKHLLNGTGFSFRCTANCEQVFEFQFVSSVSNPTNGNTYGILDITPNANINQSGATNSKKFQVGLDSFINGEGLASNVMNFILELNGGSPENINSHKVGHSNYLFQEGSKLIIGGTSNAKPGSSSNNYDFFTPLNLANISDKINVNLTIQSGANAGAEVKIPLPQIDTLVLGIDGVNVETHNSASQVITAMDGAINYISAERARLGAYQNRLEHAVSNLNNTEENLQAAESRIRDADIAKEMVTNSKNNILEQAAQAMLAQANKAPQGVLQLLQNV